MNQEESNVFWAYNHTFWYEKLSCSIHGRTQKEVSKYFDEHRIRKNIKNQFGKDLILLINQFRSPLMLILIVAIIISALLKDQSDVIIIMLIVIITGILSFFQERNAMNILEKLKKITSLKSIVIRDSIPIEIESKNVIPGDILIFNAGDLIPADCLIIDSSELYVNEASLTGESFPVLKKWSALNAETPLSKRSNCLWEGTNIISGNAKALAINIDTNTLFGHIIHNQTQARVSAFEQGVKDFGYFLTKITVVLSLIILIVNILFDKEIVESAMFALALAVGMAPELLPAITTIAMSSGAKRMLKKKVIIKKLSSIQNLGEINLLCTDKTGTLTEGNIVVDSIVDSSGEHNDFVKYCAIWNARFESGYSNPIDESLKKLDLPNLSPPIKIGEIPYDFIRKRIGIGIKTESEILCISKGAFNEILSICRFIRLPDGKITAIDAYKKSLEKRYMLAGNKGLRVIGICYKILEKEIISKEDECNMIFAGFVLFKDPIKSGIVDTINELKKLNIDLKIITGDNQNVARAIAQNIGILNPKIITGKEIDAMSRDGLNHQVKDIHIFAEVEPQHKERIILSLRNTFTVAYLGDGINDVPAIQAADIGISVENAADATREASDIVLIEKDLSVLIDGVIEGRKTFANTLKYIYISSGCTFGNMFSVAVASLFLPFLPMLPKQILLTNFISDFPYLTIASDNVDDSELKKPGKWNFKIIRNYLIIFGIHSSAFDLLTFYTLYKWLNVKDDIFQTSWFVESILTEICILFIIRTHKNFFKSKPGNFLIILGLLSFIATIALLYIPFFNGIGLVQLPLSILFAMFLIVIAYIITADILKVWFFRKFKTN